MVFNLIKVELYKLKRSKTFYFFIFLAILQNIAIYCFSEHLHIASGKETLKYMLFIQNSLAMDIMLGVFAADFIVTEFTSGYIKNLIAYGHKRIRIFISKTIVYYFAVLIISFICPLIMTILNTIRNGYGEVFTFRSFIYLLGLCLLMLIIQAAIGSVYVLTAFISKNLSITIGIVIGLDIINRILNIILVQSGSLAWIFKKFILMQSDIIASDKVTSADYLQAAIVSFITLAICSLVGIYKFNKAEIK